MTRKGEHFSWESRVRLSIAKGGNMDMFECKTCGKMFHVKPSKAANGRGKYCSRACQHAGHGLDRICEVCGTHFHVELNLIDKNGGRFCSKACYLKGRNQVGPNHPRWKGGISFEPYCPKFNADLRRRIRAFFGYSCLICGKPSSEDVRELSCHHVEYNKEACCDGKPVHFAALCTSCHAKTNEHRKEWEPLLHRIIEEMYGGRSYFTKKEWAIIGPRIYRPDGGPVMSGSSPKRAAIIDQRIKMVYGV